MLIENTALPQTGDIVAFRLATGEEVVAKLVSETETGVTIAKPVVLQMQMVGPQQAGIGLAPFMVAIDEDAKVTVQRSLMITRPVKARKEIANNYIKATTGLEIPGASSLPRMG
jgi:hypothetical protein